MIVVHRILCPVDFSEISRHALSHAMAIARWYGARVTVLHVFQVVVIPDGMGYAGLPVIAPPVEELVADLRRFAEPFQDPQVPLDFAVEEGDASRKIVEKATEIRADLIVMGTHGLGGIEHLLLGSVAEKVLRRAESPVLIVPPRVTAVGQGPGTFNRILCPIDFAPSSLRALDYALSLAQEADATLTLLHVLEPVREDVLAVSFDLAEYHRQQVQQARERLRSLVPVAAREWCQPVEMIATGKPYREILRIAREIDAGLVVMGVTGRGPVGGLLFGSTTNHVVREAACPVLTMRAHQIDESKPAPSGLQATPQVETNGGHEARIGFEKGLH